MGANVKGIEGVSWKRLARSRVQRLVAVNTVMKLPFFFIASESLMTECVIIKISWNILQPVINWHKASACEKLCCVLTLQDKFLAGRVPL